MRMQIVIYGDGTHWLFTGTGPTRMLAIADAVNHAEKHVAEFTVQTAYESRRARSADVRAPGSVS